MRAPPLKLFMTTDAVGGIFAYALDLARALVPYGVQTELAVLGPAMNARQAQAVRAVPGLRLQQLDLPLDWLASDPSEIEQSAAALARLAVKAEADVVHLNAPAHAAALYRVPVIGVHHSCLATWWRAVKAGPMPADFAWRTRALAEGLSRCNAVVCPSHAFAEAANAVYDVRPHVIHNGRALPASAEPGASPGAFAFTAGRLWDEGKNLATLDVAAGLMGLPFIAAGPLDGPHGGRITLRNAHAAGALDEAAIRGFLAPAPIFVSAALYEPFGLAVLEAAQAGCPLVLSDIPTFRELWHDAALFIAPRDAAGFATAVDLVAADPALRRRLGRAAQERAESFGLVPQAEAMAALYKALVAGPARALNPGEAVA